MIEVKPLKWYKPTDHPLDRSDEMLMAHGLGGRYSISKRQNSGPPYLLWWAHDEFQWDGYESIADAKSAAQADYEKRVLGVLLDKPAP